MGGPRFPLAMANHLNKYFAPFRLLQAENIVTAAALTAIHEMVGFSLAEPGDGILTTRPVYGRFVLDFGNTDELAMVYADSEGVDPFSPNIVPKLQQTFDNSLAQGRAIKALLIVNPNNPVGKVFTFIPANLSDCFLYQVRVTLARRLRLCFVSVRRTRSISSVTKYTASLYTRPTNGSPPASLQFWRWIPRS